MNSARFDHIAYGVERPTASFLTLRSRLGLDWVQWDTNNGFAALQARFPSGFKIEVIHPHEEHLNPFMRRFLERWGNAPHHLTFRVEGIERYFDRLRRIEVEPIAVSLESPAWREGFVHARGGIGILLQLAESDNDKRTEAPSEWSALTAAEPAQFIRLEHEVQHLERAVEILAVVDGSPLDPASDELGDFVDVVWQRDRVIRLRARDGQPDGGHRSLVVDRLTSIGGDDPQSPFIDGDLGAVVQADTRSR